MKNHEKPRKTIKNQPGTMKNHEKPWKTNLEPWKTMENHEKPTWNYEEPWKTMTNHEKPTNYFTRISLYFSYRPGHVQVYSESWYQIDICRGPWLCKVFPTVIFFFFRNHRKNCECCPSHYLIVNLNLNLNRCLCSHWESSAGRLKERPSREDNCSAGAFPRLEMERAWNMYKMEL